MGPKVRLPLPIVVILLSCFTSRSALAFSTPEGGIDAPTLTAMEERAAAAELKDRCYMYTELLHGWTELASQSMSDGNDTEAAKDLAHADADANLLKAALAKDSRKLKNAELMLEHTAHRLSDMVRVASLDQHDAMQTVLKHLNSVHDALLAQIFAH